MKANIRWVNLQRGISMISVLLGLAIAAVVGVVIFQQYNESTISARKQAAISDITTIISNAQRLYGASNQYANVDTAIAVQGGVAAHMRIAGTPTAQNRYNGALVFAPGAIAAAGDSLAITYPIDTNDCQEVIAATERLARQVTVAGTNVKNPATDGPLALATLNTQCASVATGNLAVVYVIGR